MLHETEEIADGGGASIRRMFMAGLERLDFDAKRAVFDERQISFFCRAQSKCLWLALLSGVLCCWTFRGEAVTFSLSEPSPWLRTALLSAVLA